MKKFTYLWLTCLVILSFACEKDTEEINNTQPDIPAANRSVGASANDFLSTDKFTTLTIEVDYMQGYQPTTQTITNLRNFLSTLLNKSSITIKLQEIPAQGSETYSISQIRAIEEENRDFYNVGEELTAYILFLDGYAESDEGNQVTLGVAHRNTSAALYQRRIRENSGGLGQVSRTTLESSVLNHELGHLLGLVNIGTSMESPHEDGENNGHCDDDTCLMYWAIESGGIIPGMMDSRVPSLDANCRADLRANGGR